MVMARIVNGVDSDRLLSAIDVLSSHSELAGFAFLVQNVWLGGSHSRSTIKDFFGAAQEDTSRARPFVLDSDTPAVLLGENRGPAPLEYLLHALVACLTTSLVYQASARGLVIAAVESQVEGRFDLQGLLSLAGPDKLQDSRIHITLRVTADIPAATLEQLCRLARQHSPVLGLLLDPVAVSVTLEPAE
jgi:uncharacterized OsmC-like protein